MNQADLRAAVAERGGRLGQAWLSRIERGKAEPSERMVDQILEALGSDRYELEQILKRPITEIEAAAGDPDASPLLWTWSAPVAGANTSRSRPPLQSRRQKPPARSRTLAAPSTLAAASFLSAPPAFQAPHPAPPLAEATTEFIETYEELDDAARCELIAAIRTVRA